MAIDEGVLRQLADRICRDSIVLREYLRMNGIYRDDEQVLKSYWESMIKESMEKAKQNERI